MLSRKSTSARWGSSDAIIGESAELVPSAGQRDVADLLRKPSAQTRIRARRAAGTCPCASSASRSGKSAGPTPSAASNLRREKRSVLLMVDEPLRRAPCANTTGAVMIRYCRALESNQRARTFCRFSDPNSIGEDTRRFTRTRFVVSRWNGATQQICAKCDSGRQKIRPQRQRTQRTPFAVSTSSVWL